MESLVGGGKNYEADYLSLVQVPNRNSLWFSPTNVLNKAKTMRRTEMKMHQQLETAQLFDPAQMLYQIKQKL